MQNDSHTGFKKGLYQISLEYPLLSEPAFEGSELLTRSSIVETELALLDEEVEVLSGDAVVLAQHTLGLVPEGFYAVGVVTLILLVRVTPAHVGESYSSTRCKRFP